MTCDRSIDVKRAGTGQVALASVSMLSSGDIVMISSASLSIPKQDIPFSVSANDWEGAVLYWREEANIQKAYIYGDRALYRAKKKNILLT